MTNSIRPRSKESCPIWKAPTVDVVVVTRCKDCKYVRPEVNGHTGEQVGVWCYLWDEISIGADDFCSYGEPKEGVT